MKSDKGEVTDLVKRALDNFHYNLGVIRLIIQLE